MARALEQIISELDAVYQPQKDIFKQQQAALPGQESAQLGGLEAAKRDSFQDIVTGANRRGVAFGGIPLGEQAQYLGRSYLPAVANLKGRFAGQASELGLRLAELSRKQSEQAFGMRQRELDREEEQRQFDARLAAQQAAARASGGGGGGGGGGFNFGGVVDTGTTETTQTTTSAPEQRFIGNNDYRGSLAYEASKGNTNAKTLLKYVGNDNRYDGPVNSLADYAILQQEGVGGNYYVPGLQRLGSGGGLSIQGGGGYIPSGTSSGSGLRIL